MLNIVVDISPPLGHPAIPLEWGAKISPGPCHHQDYVLVEPEEAEGLKSHSIHRQDFEAAVTAQVFIDLMKIQ